MRKVWRNKSSQDAQSDVDEHQSDHAAEERKHHALDQQLFREAGAIGAEREPERDLLLPNRGAREQKIRDVRADDQQNERNRT